MRHGSPLPRSRTSNRERRCATPDSDCAEDSVGQLDDRVAVITGGGRGIGRAIALRFASEGAIVVISSRTASDLEAVLVQITEAGGRPGHFVVANAIDRAEARRPVAEAAARVGRVDI